MKFAGKSENRNKNDKQVTAESRQFDDILQSDFLDSYVNVTLKLFSALQWVDALCPDNGRGGATQSDQFWIVKTDDDVIVDVFTLRQLIDSQSRRQSDSTTTTDPAGNTIYCSLIVENLEPIRWPFSKDYTSFVEWPDTVFPTFCYGGGYLFRSDVARLLYRQSLNETFNRHEDVLFTGIVVEHFNRRYEDNSSGAAIVNHRRSLSHRALTTRQQWSECADVACIIERRVIFTHSVRSLAVMESTWLPIRRHHLPDES